MCRAVAWTMWALSALPSTVVAATIVECLDGHGVAVLTSSSSGYGCAGGSLGTARRTTAAAAPRPTPADYPRVDVAVQRSRDSDRVRILKDELDLEFGRLAALQSASAAAASGPGPRAETPVLAEAAAQLARVQENIRALQRELAGTAR